MKKILFFSIISFFFVDSHAQIRVDNRGNMSLGYQQNILYTRATITDTLASITPSLSSRRAGLAAYTYPDKSYNYGVVGSCVKPSGSSLDNFSYGVYGVAGGNAGQNYGLYGYLKGSDSKGAAVFGSISTEYGPLTMNGRYAGYFGGDVMIAGCAQTNLVNFYDDASQSFYTMTNALNIVSGLTPIVKLVSGVTAGQSLVGVEETDDADNEEESDRAIFTHYALRTSGVPSPAQNLLVSDRNSNSFINYTELIPVLVGAIQELQAQLLSLQTAQAAAYPTMEDDITSVQEIGSKDVRSSCCLFQNSPNPFTGNTVIRYALPEDVNDALICVFNMQGTMLSQTNVSPSTDRITINGSDYGPGMYIYSLIVNGREMDSKRMILTK